MDEGVSRLVYEKRTEMVQGGREKEEVESKGDCEAGTTVGGQNEELCYCTTVSGMLSVMTGRGRVSCIVFCGY